MPFNLQDRLSGRQLDRILQLTSQIDVVNTVMEEVGSRALAAGASLDDLQQYIGADTLARWKAIARAMNEEKDSDDSESG